VSDSTQDASGLLVVDKPAGLTSHTAVARARRLVGSRRVGHAGTLDPMATGVLVLGVGRGTRLLHYLVGVDKEYEATVRLGAATTTDDAEGEVVRTADADSITEQDVATAVETFVGEIDQVPSAVSAIKVDGKRAYARVRDGEDVSLAPRRVTVSRFDVIDVRRTGDGVDVDVRVACSSGTYVRALARDLGETLGVGGHLTALRRTSVGCFSLDEATALDDLVAPVPLMDLGSAASRALPVRRLADDEARQVRHGVPPAPTGRAGPVALLDSNGALVAVSEDAGPRADLRAVFVG
jgi:tRNA pseudouridine55 synthase